MAAEKKQFILHKRVSYLVTVIGQGVIFEYMQDQKVSSFVKTIAGTLQIIGNTQLMLNYPRDPVNTSKNTTNPLDGQLKKWNNFGIITRKKASVKTEASNQVNCQIVAARRLI